MRIVLVNVYYFKVVISERFINGQDLYIMESYGFNMGLMTRRIDNGRAEREINLEIKIKETFANCKFEIRWPYSRPMNPDDETIEVLLRTHEGKAYISNFTTAKHIERMLRECRTDGDDRHGTYFAQPGMVVLESLTPENIRKTIDYMIEHLEIDEYFEELKGD